jgi:hypothetical protein
MSDVEYLLKAIERDPDDLTAVACLTDALMDERDYTRSEADRAAELAVQSTRDVRDLAQAARLLTEDNPVRSDLMRDIIARASVPAVMDAQIIITVGWAEPTAKYDTQQTGGFWYPATVTVGASWVIQYHRRNISLSSPAQTVRRSKRASIGRAAR